MTALTALVEIRVRETTHDRIRDLSVEEDQGRVVIRGQATTQHARQMALHGAHELLSGDCLRAEITVS
jgi:hypothetical protein